MSKQLKQLVIFGGLAVFCLSARPSGELAMAKCSREPTEEPQKKCKIEEECPKCNQPKSCRQETDQQSDAAKVVQTTKKSAAQKVVEGI